MGYRIAKFLPFLFVLALIGCATRDGLVHLPNGDPQCPAGQWVNAMNPMACATPVAAGGGTYPAGGPPKIAGYSATNTPESETVGNDCTFSRTGANAYAITCTTAGGGTGNFQAGIISVGIGPGLAVLGDVQVEDGIAIGSNSVGVSAGAGNVVMDGAMTCNNSSTGSSPASCVNINSGGIIVPVFGLDAGTNFLFGGATSFGQIFQSSVGTSQTFKINTTTIMQIAASGVTFQVNGGSAVKLNNGAVLTMTGGTLPTLTTCNGAGSSVTAGSTPNRGQFATQTAGCSTATVHFTQTMPQKMFCVCGDGNATITPVTCSYDLASSSTTQAVFDFANAGASYKYDYTCE